MNESAFDRERRKFLTWLGCGAATGVGYVSFKLAEQTWTELALRSQSVIHKAVIDYLGPTDQTKNLLLTSFSGRGRKCR
jgi:hypothetical protein